MTVLTLSVLQRVRAVPCLEFPQVYPGAKKEIGQRRFLVSAYSVGVECWMRVVCQWYVCVHVHIKH